MDSAENCWFSHEKLEVYQQAITFVAWLSPFLEGSICTGDIRDQLDRASASIPLNIAEGNGKFSPKDRCRFFDIAHASALECAAALDVLVDRSKATRQQTREGKQNLLRIIRLLMGLIKRNSDRHYGKSDALDS